MAAGERLRSIDAAWFHMDRPDNTADVVAVLALAHPLPLEELRRLVDARIAVHPAFRSRVRPGPRGATFEEDPDFALDRHVVAARLDAPGPGPLRELASRVATEPLDPALPLWKMHLVERAGGSALVVKVHHCLGDGFALVALLLSLAGEAPRQGTPSHRVDAYRELELGEAPGRAVRGAVRSVAGAVALGREALAFTRSLARMTLLRRDPRTVLSGPLTGRRRVAWTAGLPLGPVRAAARGAGATVHDLLVAALAGALRAELQAAGEPVDRLALRALVPVNLRAMGGDAEGVLGNRFGLVFLDLPVERAHRADRIRAVRSRLVRLKRTPDAVVTYAVLAILGKLPPSLARVALDFFSRKASLVMTNVPGPRRRLSLAGRVLEEAMFWVPHPAQLGVGVSILTYAGEVRVGVRADEGALREPERLLARFVEELEAIVREATAGGAVVTQVGAATE